MEASRAGLLDNEFSDERVSASSLQAAVDLSAVNVPSWPGTDLDRAHLGRLSDHRTDSAVNCK